MLRVNKILTPISMLIIGLVLFTGVSCAITHSDENNNGVNEVGETITFVGDDSYVDENSVEHPIYNWYWDFDSDGIIDALGQIVTHTYDELGTYLVTVYEICDLNLFIQFQLTVVIPLPEAIDPTYEDILQQAKDDIDALLEKTINKEYDEDYKDKFGPKGDGEKKKDMDDLSKSSSIIDNELESTGEETLLPLEAVKLLVKNLAKVDKRGIIDTTDIMLALTDLLLDKVEETLNDAEAEYGSNNPHVKKALDKFNKGLDKVEKGEYDRAVDELIRAYRELERL